MDKFKSTLQNLPQFSVGESPGPLKMNRAFKVVQEALEKIETELSDTTLFDSGNTALSQRPLIFSGIGRLLGPSDALSIECPANETYSFEVDLIAGRSEWTLPVIPHDKASHDLSIVSTLAKGPDGSLLFQTEKAVASLLTAPGDWKYLPEENKIISYSHMATGSAKATGTTFPNADRQTQRLSSYSSLGAEVPAIQPRLNIIAPSSIVVTVEADPLYDYLVTMGTEVVTHQSPIHIEDNAQLNKAGVDSASGFDQAEKGCSLLPTSTSDAQMRLPYLFDTLFGSGNQVPRSLLLLFDETSGTLYDEALYYYRDSTSFWIKGPTLTPANSFRVVTNIGSQISTLLEGLRFEAKHHSHIGSNSVSHQVLDNLGYSPGLVSLPVEATTAHGLQKATVKSSMKGHPHPQYLTKYGLLYGLDPENNNGLMEGPLAIGLKPSDARNASFSELWGKAGVASWPLVFGNVGKLEVTPLIDGNAISLKSMLLMSGNGVAWGTDGSCKVVGMVSSKVNLNLLFAGDDVSLESGGSSNSFGDNAPLSPQTSSFEKCGVKAFGSNCTIKGSVLDSKVEAIGDGSSVSGTILRSRAMAQGKQSSVSLTNGTADVDALASGDGSNLIVESCTSSKIRLSGKQATVTTRGLVENDLSIVSPNGGFDTESSVVYGENAFVLSPGDTYRRARNFVIDSEQKVIRVPIIKGRVVYVSPTPASGIKIANPPSFEWSDSSFGGKNTLYTHLLGDPIPVEDLIYELGLPSNAALKKIHLSLFWSAAVPASATAQILGYDIDGAELGSPILYTSTITPAAGDTDTIEVLDFDFDSTLPGIKVNGSRYPSETTYSLSLSISDTPRLIGGWVEYRLMRF